MSIADTAHAIETSTLGVTIAQSTWLFPTIETVHVIALALVAGSIAVVDLRLLDLSWRRRPITDLAREILPWTWASFVMAAISGALMFSSAATKYVADLPFRLKILLLLMAGANMLVFNLITYKSVRTWDVNVPTPTPARIAAALSLTFWIAIVFCGRLVGFTTSVN